LPATAFWVPVVVGVLGVVPAFAIAYRLAVLLAGLTAAVVVGTNPLFLGRSIGSDNDVCNVVVPLFGEWAAVEALGPAPLRRRAALAALAAVMVGSTRACGAAGRSRSRWSAPGSPAVPAGMRCIGSAGASASSLRSPSPGPCSSPSSLRPV
jgi:hypothetical protein